MKDILIELEEDKVCPAFEFEKEDIVHATALLFLLLGELYDEEPDKIFMLILEYMLLYLRQQTP